MMVMMRVLDRSVAMVSLRVILLVTIVVLKCRGVIAIVVVKTAVWIHDDAASFIQRRRRRRRRVRRHVMVMMRRVVPRWQ